MARANSVERKQVNVRVETDLYEQLAARAKLERRSVPQTARLLLSDALGGLEQPPEPQADSSDLAALASAGRAFDWVAEEPELYSREDGEAL